jgi:hypothetical protein
VAGSIQRLTVRGAASGGHQGGGDRHGVGVQAKAVTSRGRGVRAGGPDLASRTGSGATSIMVVETRRDWKSKSNRIKKG